VTGLRTYELPPDLFSRVESLFATAWFDEAQIGAGLEGRQPVRVFVDDPQRPGAALLCHPYDYYIAGSVNPALRRFIADAPAEAGVFAQVYGYCPVGADWERALLSDAGGRLVLIPRRSFKYRHEAPPAAGKLPAVLSGFRRREAEVRAIDAELAEQIDRRFMRAISRNWRDRAAFLSNAFGFCVTVADEVVAIGLPAAVSRRYADLDVETAPAFRRHGLAYAVCARFIAECFDRGLIACWDTDGPNLASAALAVKLGFSEEMPFSELGNPERTPPPLFSGRWTRQESDNSTWQWVRTAESGDDPPGEG
jgi:RimJ/RimL family protein N-acetyltransferase